MPSPYDKAVGVLSCFLLDGNEALVGMKASFLDKLSGSLFSVTCCEWVHLE